MRMRAHWRRVRAVAVIAVLAAGCEAGSDPDASSQGEEMRREVLAPIDQAELLVLDGEPPAYAVRIVSGLPSGCARFERIDVRREGGQVDIFVWNTMPAAEGIACTMIYGTAENTVDLGAGFDADGGHTLRINGEPVLAFPPR